MTYLILETKLDFEPYKSYIIEVLSSACVINKITRYERTLVFHTNGNDFDVLKELLISLSEELVLDIKAYIALNKPTYSLDTIMKYFYKVNFKETKVYDETSFIYHMVIQGRTEDLKRDVLKSIYRDKELQKTALLFLEHNQNMTEASKVLFVHRNTLIQRLEKIYLKTGLNLKKFIDGYIIYTLIKN